jgi:MFS transporter, UMF1 family
MSTLSQPMVKDDPRTIFGWCMYDWANSAYITIGVGLLPVYFASVVVGEQGAMVGGTRYAADTIWGALVGSADVLAFLAAPVLGAIADFSGSKKKSLLFFAYMGSLASILLFFARTGDLLMASVLFVIAQLCFINANVVYDAFLPQIASEAKMDWISGKGYSFGYIGVAFNSRWRLPSCLAMRSWGYRKS